MFCRSELVIDASEGADQRVGGYQTADQVIAHRVGDGVPDRLLYHGLPPGRGVGVAAVQDVPAGLVAGTRRFDQRWPQPLGHQSATPVERGERVLVAGSADRRERLARVRPDKLSWWMRWSRPRPRWPRSRR
jgi:hypothetical protein